MEAAEVLQLDTNCIIQRLAEPRHVSKSDVSEQKVSQCGCQYSHSGVLHAPGHGPQQICREDWRCFVEGVPSAGHTLPARPASKYCISLQIGKDFPRISLMDLHKNLLSLTARLRLLAQMFLPELRLGKKMLNTDHGREARCCEQSMLPLINGFSHRNSATTAVSF